MKKRFNSKGQNIFGMSFGVIFSIIIIIFIIVVAGLVIRAFLSSSDCTKLGMFLDDGSKTSFTFAVEKAWKSSGINFDYSGQLPSSIEYVCFANLSSDFYGEFEGLGFNFVVFDNDNMFFYPTEETCNIPAHELSNLDIETITSSDNPYCIPVKNGKIVINIEKGINKKYVVVK